MILILNIDKIELIIIKSNKIPKKIMPQTSLILSLLT